jgi:hypothetical protein
MHTRRQGGSGPCGLFSRYHCCASWPGSASASRPGPPEHILPKWLPVSSRPFNVMLRVYGVRPGSTVANNTYVPPPVVKN